MRPPADINMIESTKARTAFSWRWDTNVVHLRPLLIVLGLALIAVLSFGLTSPFRASSLTEAFLYLFFSSALLPLFFPLFLIGQTLFNTTTVTVTPNAVIVEQKPLALRREQTLAVDEIKALKLLNNTTYNSQGARTRHDLIAVLGDHAEERPLILKWPERSVLEYTQFHIKRMMREQRI